MSLSLYKQKRKFDKTPEPAGKVAKLKNTLSFVVQKHEATALHYDFRLELDGVLISWAIPKGPTIRLGEKHLAMKVEDHPFEYKDFEGVIPEGNYGAGPVMIWDEGNYSSLETADPIESTKILRKGLKNGQLKFFLNGTKLQGGFALIKIKKLFGKESDKSWLFIKERDSYAKDQDISKLDKSVKTGLSMKEIASGSEAKGKVWHSNRKVEELDLNDLPKNEMPHSVRPMLAKLTDNPFDKVDWLFEIKWDGFRAISEIKSKKSKIYSRNLQSFDELFAPIGQTLNTMPFDAVLDGEVVVLDKVGKSHFQLLQNYQTTGKGNLVYYVFDILHLNGRDLRELPLIDRKEILRKILPKAKNIRFSDHVQEKGTDFFKIAQAQNLEGIIAKQSQSTYKVGKRSEEWLKIKTHMQQETVIGGFTEPRGSRSKFGALVLGVYKDGDLNYVGHTGGGFNENSLNEIYQKLKPLIIKESPFNSKFKTNAPVTWVKPKLLAEVSFAEWTSGGQMRQPIFLGLRSDKSASHVVKEEPKTFAEQFSRKAPSSKEKDVIAKIDGNNVTLTHLSKVYWPKEKYTKGDLVDYYQKAAKYILPYLANRPESMNRHPHGIEGESFFQKDVTYVPPKWAKTHKIFSESNSKHINYLVCQNESTLIYMANLGCIEINPWLSRIGSLEKPDFAVIDLDPEKISFEKVVEVAQTVHQVLDELKVKSFCKTSGATGLHIFVPLGAKYSYDQSKQFAQLVATIVNNKLPKITSMERSPKKRQGKVYLDYLQNRKGQTLAAAYSVRPKPGATVSTPLEWKEVKKGLNPKDFNIKNIFKRLDKKGDLWKGVLGSGIDLLKILKKL